MVNQLYVSDRRPASRHPVWDWNRVRKMFEQRRYHGVVVPAQLFDHVQALMESKHRGARPRQFEYPLSGAIKCSGRKRSFHGHTTGGTRKKRVADGSIRTYPNCRRVRYYYCTVCNYRINAELLEGWFRADVRRLAGDEQLLRRWIRGQAIPTDLTAAAEELARIEQRFASNYYDLKRKRAWDLAIDSEQSVAADLARHLERIAADERETRERRQELQRILESESIVHRTFNKARDLLARFWELYDSAKYEQKRELAAMLVLSLGGAVANKGGISWTACAVEEMTVATS